GTGYSSLSTLKQYPIDSLKIDKSFLAGLGNVKDNAEIVRAIVNLAHNMAMDVTVEGVETEGQLKFVTNLGCEYAQGYYFSKPMPTEAAARTLVQGYRLTTIPPHSPAISQRGLGRGRVLVVEDDPVRRNQLRLALEADGFDALTAASGHQAIEVASADAPEVVLLDLELSGMTGVETCRRLKQSSETAGIPVIFLVEDDELTLDAAETLKAGAADLLSVKTPAAVLAARLDSQITVARAQNRLRRMAMTDELTGVFSRRFLFQALRRAIKAGTRRATAGLAVVLVDVDHFKRVNDTHGHIEGDRALKRIAQTIDDATRETDLVARFGGEEFVVMLQDTTLDGARTVAEKILRAVREDCDATLSIGIAHLSHEELAVDAEEDVDERITVLLRHAEAALEEAKARGRDQVVLKSAIDTSP
ncbi:MAG: diguanylate cyclase, partial [Myxococcales bacterium]|nr:diguanylate cyclase [Myxococcales bacterium]